MIPMCKLKCRDSDLMVRLMGDQDRLRPQDYVIEVEVPGFRASWLYLDNHDKSWRRPEKKVSQ